MKHENINPIRDARVRAVLQRLHSRADSQLQGRDHADFYRDKLIPIDKEQGWLIYLLCRSLGARRVVEYGTSRGVSTLYLASAIRDNGGGVVIGTEIEPAKVAAASANFAEAGLTQWIELREGDALETLKDCGGPVDFLLVDGWSELALPIMQRMTPQLRKGAIVVCDNVGHFPKPFRPFTQFMRDPANGFVSTLLPLRSGTELAVRV